ncbi:DUF86 domain-containing protein [Candidatus Uhrbacteria bacterium]|nr:DUF86 domain-containing protein [Candidatus Uhrbacteria bacterium]
MDRDNIYLQEIREFCDKVIQFTSGISSEQFTHNEQLQFAIIKLIENIGEASKRLSKESRAKYPHVEWRKVMAMRDKLVHDYMDVDIAIVYDVAVREIPTLLKGLQ